jgi:guanylate kinase
MSCIQNDPKGYSVTPYSGWLITLVGPAGAGKNHLMHTALDRISRLEQLPTATTRAIRPGEQEGREHFYLTRSAFEALIKQGKLLEHQEIHGNLYGMLRDTVETALSEGRIAIADIDILGALYARELYPNNTLSIFIQPPSIAALIERMRARKDKDAEIAKRLVRVPMEMAHANRCDYRIVNDDARRASDLLVNIIQSVITGNPIPQPPGETGALCQFRYQVAVAPILNGETLIQNGKRLLTSMPNGETLPHRAALAAAQQAWSIDADETQIIGGERDGAFIPPMSFTCEERDAEEIVTFTYGLRLNERITPDGWTWTPLEARTAIPETL